MGETDKKPPTSDDGSYKKKWNKKKRYTNKPPTIQPEKFVGGKDEIGGNYFDCTG
jgi:hypothetical protein